MIINKKIISIFCIILSLFLMSGCQTNNYSGLLHMNLNLGYSGAYHLTEIETDAFNPFYSGVSTTSINLDETKKQIILAESIEFREEYSNYAVKYELCNSIGQFGEYEEHCDIVQYKVIRTNNNIELISEACDDCKKDLGLIKDITLELGDVCQYPEGKAICH